MEEFPTLHCTEQQSKDPTAPSGILALSLPPESGPPPSEVQGHGAGFSGEHSPLCQPSVLISCPGQVLQQPYMPCRGRHQPTLPCLRFCLLERPTLSLRAPVLAASWEGPAQGTTAEGHRLAPPATPSHWRPGSFQNSVRTAGLNHLHCGQGLTNPRGIPSVRRRMQPSERYGSRTTVQNRPHH